MLRIKCAEVWIQHVAEAIPSSAGALLPKRSWNQRLTPWRTFVADRGVGACANRDVVVTLKDC